MLSRLPSPPLGALRAEARTLFTLAEAAAENGLFATAPLEARWRELAQRCADKAPLELVAPELHALLSAALHHRGDQAGWIGERWKALETRLHASP